jgi:catechol 2,3-dioxygenase-like lactoylglutathione lyase family enzyme
MNTRRLAMGGIIGILVWTTLSPAHAQLADPNSAGVAMGHYHLYVQNIDEQRRFWANLGGTSATLGDLVAIRFADVYVALEQAGPRAGTDGSVVGHISFKVRVLKEAWAKLEAGGWKVTPSPINNPKQAFVVAPDGIRVELNEDESVGSAAGNHHIHFYTPAIPEMQEWYVKVFGSVPGKRDQFDAADLPGVNLSFSRARNPVAPTAGRVLDHIGFEVRDLKRFCQHLEASGVKLDQEYSKPAGLPFADAFLTDPWGTRIELTEGLR